MGEELIKEGGKYYAKVETNVDDRIKQLEERKTSLEEELLAINGQLATLHDIKQ